MTELTENGTRNLIAAIALQAVNDCKRGNYEAAQWLENDPEGMLAYLGHDLNHVRKWVKKYKYARVFKAGGYSPRDR